MLRGMTAYGRAKKNYTDVEIVVDIQSVNKKHLDLHIKLPYECLSFESNVRKTLSENIERGHVTVNIQVLFLSEYPAKVIVNSSYVKSLKEAAAVLAKELGAKVKEEELLWHLLKERGVLQVSHEGLDSPVFLAKLEETLLLACQELTAMKQKEGESLKAEFLRRLETLDGQRGQIAALTGSATEKYRKRLKELLKEFIENDPVIEERIAKECAIMADKVDISEELSRFGFHIEHFKSSLTETRAVGKVLEFILQEMQREVNTIASKSQEAQISKLVIGAKGEIEKLREQVQNVE